MHHAIGLDFLKQDLDCYSSGCGKSVFATFLEGSKKSVSTLASTPTSKAIDMILGRWINGYRSATAACVLQIRHGDVTWNWLMLRVTKNGLAWLNGVIASAWV